MTTDDRVPRGAPTSAWTRRRFLKAGAITAVGAAGIGAIVAGLGLESGAGPAASGSSAVPSGQVGAPNAAASAAAAAAAAGRRRRYRSRPDLSTAPIEILTQPTGVAPGLILISPNNGLPPDGLLIIDDAGRPIWIHPTAPGEHAVNLAVAHLRGEPVLTWWEGTLNGGNGSGDLVAVDSAYREVLRVGAGGGHKADLHEFLITPTGTILAFWGGSGVVAAAPGASAVPWQLWDDAIEETDIASGKVIFEWHTRDHIAIEESILPPPTTANAAYDAVHLNSIDIDTDGHLLVSARNTSTVYKIDRSSGDIIWRLGGKKSDFTFGPGAAFSWQHDVRRQPDGTITVFDDETAPAHGRAIVLAVDEASRTVALVRAYDHPHALIVQSQGSARFQANGNLFVGWGSTPYLSEFSHDGTLLYDVTFPDSVQSYRSIRAAWVGRPAEPPTLVVEAATDGSPTAYMSWNGATDVARWELLGGDDRASLTSIGSAERADFETSIPVTGGGRFVLARALDSTGRVLGSSALIPAVPTSPAPSPSAS